jgi:amino acid transporter
LDQDPTPATERRKLGFWPMVALIFFTVSGGAYGLEALVGAVGAQLAIALVVFLPLFWALPISLMVAELSTAIPEDGGYYVWVRRGLGPFWGFQEGWWTLCYSAVDMALYPVLFTTYLSYFVPWLGVDSPDVHLIRWGISVVFIAAALLFNLRGSHAVGMNALANLLLVSFPFALITLWGIFAGSWTHLGQALTGAGHQPIAPAQVAAGLAIVLWNYCGWDNVSTYASEVKNPSRTLPRALFAGLLIIMLSYVLPLLAAFKTTVRPEDWVGGAGWPTIAAMVGGPWLGFFGAAAALLSAWSLFNSQLLYIARLPAAIAADGFLPQALARTSPRTGVPVTALLVMAGAASLFSYLSLSKLMVVDILFYTLGLSLEFVALIALRAKEPGLHRPFRIPLGTLGLSLLSAPPILLAVAVAAFSTLGEDGSLLQVGVVALGIISGIGIYTKVRHPKPIQPVTSVLPNS